MFELIEANPLPSHCIECEEKAKLYYAADEAEKLKMEQEGFCLDCGSCDYGAERFYYSREDALRIRKKGLQKSIDRLRLQITEIDKELGREK